MARWKARDSSFADVTTAKTFRQPLPAQQLLYAGIELPPDAAVLGFVGEIAGNFGVPRVGSALKGAPGVAVAEHAAVLLPDEPGIDGRCASVRRRVNSASDGTSYSKLTAVCVTYSA